MKKYKLLKEHDSHFDMEHEKQGAFVVAKYGLDDATIKKIRSFGAAHYAEGTKDAEGVKPSDAPGLMPKDTSLNVTDYLLSSNDQAPALGAGPMRLPEDNLQIAQAVRKREENPDLQYDEELVVNKPQGMEKPEESADAADYFDLIPSSAQRPRASLALEPVTPAGSKSLADLKKELPKNALPYQLQNQKSLSGGIQGVPAGPQTQTEIAGTGLPQDPMQASQNAFDGLKQANLEMGQIEAQKELKIQEEQIKALNNMRDLDNSYKTNLKNIDDEQKRLSDGIANFKIDPNRVYSQMGSGNRILAAVSLVLGGISQGLLGLRSNPAMDVINDTINRDIDAQKANLGTKQSLLALNLEKYKRLDAATAATRAQLLTVVQAQINLAASKANSSLALKNAQLANYKLDMEKAKLNQSVATNSTVNQVLNTQQGLPEEYVMRMPENIRELLVRVPNGKFYPAISPKAAEKARDGLASVSSIKSLASRAKALFDQGVIKPWSSKEIGLAESYSSQLDLEIKNLSKLGVLSEGDMKIINKIKPDLTALTFRDKETAKIDALNQYIDRQTNGYLSGTVPNYSPGNITEEGVSP